MCVCVCMQGARNVVYLCDHVVSAECMAQKSPDACVNQLIDKLLTASPHQGAGGPPLAAIIVPVMVVGECSGRCRKAGSSSSGLAAQVGSKVGSSSSGLAAPIAEQSTWQRPLQSRVPACKLRCMCECSCQPLPVAVPVQVPCWQRLPCGRCTAAASVSASRTKSSRASCRTSHASAQRAQQVAAQPVGLTLPANTAARQSPSVGGAGA